MKTSHGPDPLERDIQRSMLRWLRNRPRSFTVKLAAGPFSMPGLPDILHIEAGHAIFIEVKRPGGSLTPLQKSVFAMLLKAGATCIVASSLDVLKGKMGSGSRRFGKGKNRMNITTERFAGDCLEGIGFPCKGTIEIDRDAKPKVGDVVYCSGPLGGELGGFLKQVIKTGGPHPIVHTCYKDRTRDFAYFAVETFGVVLRAFDEAGTLCWERDKNVFMLTCPRCGADMDGGEIYERSKRNMDLYDRETSGGDREGI